ncbi:hypothetical protein OE749_03305 [Aestuariibacter sp. AA17]|uniref:Uncharacterized protein n=1 Tax=Fluctibacter corallii TaxID=2984329 RepID=A0ABT3A512_9ALTE|nr:hypothetical protein [Aestuariibacter sp. AA17]MCV2883729.1 hypothetical protein [Aestuariibacter sp. AA17]
MISGLSALSVQKLYNRNFNQENASEFGDLLSRAQTRTGSAKQFLENLSPEELALVQKAHGLVDKINVSGLSAEGAQNLLSQPDGTGLVDPNNDGIVEVGIARTIHFPPVNSPQYVKDAWEKATEGLSMFDKATMELSMHFQIYGVNIDGLPTKPPLPPERQWSQAGIQALMENAWSNWEFRVNMEGMTDYNRQMQNVYKAFESELQSHWTSGVTVSPHAPVTYVDNPAYQKQTDKSENETAENQTHSSSLIDNINQLLIDARLGIDRKKLEELDDKMKEVENDDSLTPEQKQVKLQALQLQKERMLEEAQKRAVEEEKRKATLNVIQKAGETLSELDIKHKINQRGLL